MKYLCLKNHERFEKGPYALVPIREGDMESIRKWRNAQMNILRQDHLLTKQEQKCYWQEHILPTFALEKPPILLFSFLKDDLCIGYGGLTYLNWSHLRAEVSFLMDPAFDAPIEKMFAIFLPLLKQVAFDALGLHRLFTETYDIRPQVIEALEEAGFVFEGRLKDHVKIDGRFVDALIHGLVDIPSSFRVPAQ